MRKTVSSILAISLLLLVASCAVKSAKIQKIVTERIDKTKKNKALTSNIELHLDKKMSVTTNCVQQKSSFIPALFYWGWDSQVLCEFDKETLETKLKEITSEKIESYGLKKYFEGKKITITIEELPTKFTYQDKGSVIYLIVAYAMMDKISFVAEKQNFKGKYVVSDLENNIIFESQIDKNFKIGSESIVDKSTKKLTWIFLDTYNDELTRLISYLIHDIKEKSEVKNVDLNNQ